ncbi:MAG: LamG-like jellyroll fold domain-containing protein [Planctomycetota bacterium]|jgi:hypothetical protein
MRKTLLLLAFGLSAAAGDPSPPAERDSFTFVVFGDRTSGAPDGVQVLAVAVEAAGRLDPDFVLTVGDAVQGYTTTKPWLEQMKEYKEIMNRLRRPWYPVAGNHDVYGGRGNPGGNEKLYREHFAPLYYSFDYKWAHFVVLYSDEKLGRGPGAQNMSSEQIAWLKNDLAQTRAKQVYVFLHQPRWNYRGTNWPDVHEVLAGDGRVQAVVAGHLHVYRDDGVRDGVHYYTLAVTGGRATPLKTPSALHHLTHVKVTRAGYTLSVLPVGGVLGANMVLGPEVDRLYALRRGDWLELEGEILWEPERERATPLDVVIANPAETPVAYELRLHLSPGWKAESLFVGGHLAPGGTKKHGFRVSAPPFDGRPPNVRLQATLHHPLKSGLVHPVHHVRRLPFRVVGLPTGRTRKNGVLVVDSGHAVRVDLPPVPETFTLECWARGEEPWGTQAVVSKLQNAGFGILWCSDRSKLPFGLVGFAEGGYREVRAAGPWKWERWTHLALTCDEGRVRFFVDGKLQAERTRASPRTRSPHSLYLGADPDRRNRPSQFFRGAIDEVRLSSIVRYQKDFKPTRHHRRDAQTLLLLHCDERTHGVFPDDSGHDRHGWPFGKPRLVRESR